MTTGCWLDSADDAPVDSPDGPVEGLYVSPDGQDDWPGTEEQPWRTLRHALPALEAGQVLYVRGGVYREQLVKLNLNQGRPASRIVVQAYEGEQPVVRGLVWLREPSYWTVDGIDVTWDKGLDTDAQHMVKLTGGVGWTWQGSEIWGAQAGANVLIAGRGADRPADWSFTENCVHDVSPSSRVQRGSNIAVGAMDRAGPGSITRNVVFGSEAARNIALGVSRAGSDGPTDVTVAYNTLYGARVAVSLSGDTSGSIVEGNLLGGPSSGALVRASQLTGAENLVRENAGVNAGRFYFEQTGELKKGSGNVMVDLGFGDVSCDGLRSDQGSALSYGRDAVL
jgi:hypothetical protein